MVIARLGVAAMAYYIWQERNKRIFCNHARPPEVLTDLILGTVRYKLMSLKFKPSARVKSLLLQWDIHGEDVFDDGG
jgi:hypothetical protein